MTSSNEIFPTKDSCEICGAPLGDEVVIQEFADGSLARLCKECAAGTALDQHGQESSESEAIPPSNEQDDSPSFPWPEAPVEYQPQEDLDPLEKTRELLMPINELISLQREMQSALERLAASLEHFAAEMITESQGKSAVETRLRTLEMELEKTRTLLEQTDLGLAAGSTTGIQAASTKPGLTPEDTLAISPRNQTDTGPAAAPSPPSPPTESPAPPKAELQAVPPEQQPGSETEPQAGFRLDEVQMTQRYYNESAFVRRIREIMESLGKPRANLTRVPGPMPRAIVTIYWDIVWYQYLIDLRRDLPGAYERVTLYREGMDLEELAPYFKEKNAIVNDDGRLDASELEVRLLSDPSALITEMTAEEARLLDDITEKIWDQSSAPEFRWDD